MAVLKLPSTLQRLKMPLMTLRQYRGITKTPRMPYAVYDEGTYRNADTQQGMQDPSQWRSDTFESDTRLSGYHRDERMFSSIGAEFHKMQCRLRLEKLIKERQAALMKNRKNDK